MSIYTASATLHRAAKPGKDGVSQICAYTMADTKPTKKPTVTSYSTFKNTNNLGNGWEKKVVQMDVVQNRPCVYNIQFIPGDTNGSNDWTKSGNWHKSPIGLSDDNGYAKATFRFDTLANNQTVVFRIKASSEENYDLMMISTLNGVIDNRNKNGNYVSGDDQEKVVSFTCSERGSYSVMVAYMKDGSSHSNGDYGLARLSEEECSKVTVRLYRIDGSVEDDTITWGEAYPVTGAKGDTGPTGRCRQHVGFVNSTYTYLVGEGDDEFWDVVLYKNQWYKCKKRWTGSGVPGSDKNQEKPEETEVFKEHFDAGSLLNSDFVATRVFLAENGYIQLLGSQKLYVENDSGLVTIQDASIVIQGKDAKVDENGEIIKGDDNKPIYNTNKATIKIAVENGYPMMVFTDKNGNVTYSIGYRGQENRVPKPDFTVNSIEYKIHNDENLKPNQPQKGGSATVKVSLTASNTGKEVVDITELVTGTIDGPEGKQISLKYRGKDRIILQYGKGENISASNTFDITGSYASPNNTVIIPIPVNYTIKFMGDIVEQGEFEGDIQAI